MKKKVFLWGAVVVALDQLIKLLITSFVSIADSIPVIKHFFYITYIRNEGAAWNIFSGDRWFLIIISIVAVYGIIKYFLLDLYITKLELVGYSLMLGGIIGNLIDRLFRSTVVDYLDFYLGNYNFPVFNLADSCLVVGSILVIFHLIRGTKKNEVKGKKA